WESNEPTMPLSANEVLQILYPGNAEGRSRRFTQDTPILPDVWIEYGRDLTGAHELLMAPPQSCSAAKPAQVLARRLARDVRRNRRKGEKPEPLHLTFNDSHVWVKMTLAQLIRVALPLSSWWRDDLGNPRLTTESLRKLERRKDFIDMLIE